MSRSYTREWVGTYYMADTGTLFENQKIWHHQAQILTYGHNYWN